MTKSLSGDPFDGIPFRERRSWRAAERRVRRQHEAEQLEALVGLAATGVQVTGVSAPATEPAPGGLQTTPVEMILSGRRLRAARVHSRTISRLRDALSGLASVPLTAASRYGPYWVLTFKLATGQLVVLAENLTLLPDWGGPGGRHAGPIGPRVLQGV